MDLLQQIMCGLILCMPVFGFIVYTEISESRWWELRQAKKKFFGEQRGRILVEKWKLQDLRNETGDPDKRLQAAIERCNENIRALDLAVVRMHQSAIEGIKEQRTEVERILQDCSHDPTVATVMPQESKRVSLRRTMTAQ